MRDVDFESTSLWQQTLGAVHDGDRLRHSYLAARDNAKVLLGELSHSTPHFTVHDITHVDALWETATVLCGSSVQLTPAEGYVLGCAFILHDAAMGAASYQESIPSTIGLPRWRDLLSSFIVDATGNWPTAEQLATPDEDIATACMVHAIRELHAAHAVKLVDQAWPTAAGNALYLIEDLQLGESFGPLIGDLAASHWWPVERLESHFRRRRGSLPWHPSDWTVDPLKLACLLRLADATQVDSRRAPTFLFTLRRPEGNSRDHWRFQEHVARPELQGDRVTYTSWRPFETKDADAWWLALDYLRGVDKELKKVDALLHDLGRPRFEGRAVAGVDSPERFAELFPVKGWRPVDARIDVSDVPRLVEILGGEQLYGNDPEVSLRELLQNAQDATMARKSLDPDFADDEIVVSLTEQDGRWTLEVTDRGVGMDEEILTTALLDFGRTGWTSDTVRNKFVGLADGRFRPKGRFGIGFFSVFMLGDNIEIVTRRFDASASDARTLRFRGVRARPILTPIAADRRTPIGTRIRVELKLSPYDDMGLFVNTRDDRIDELIQRICPERSVPIRAAAQHQPVPIMLPSVRLSSAEPAHVFDILYPPLESGGMIGEAQRRSHRNGFVQRATEVTAEDGARIGLAALGEDFYFDSPRDLWGKVLVNGFRGDEYLFFAGYIQGRPSRASRDKVELDVTRAELCNWLASQETRMRELNLLTDSMQAETASLFLRANRSLPSDYNVAFIANGLLKCMDVAEWAAAREEIVVTQGWPITLNLRPLAPFHPPSGRVVELPAGWVLPLMSTSRPPFTLILGSSSDKNFEYARLEHKNTWQKMWWRTSGTVEGLVLELICQAWECEIGDILAPVEKRGWSDFEDIGYENIGPVPVWRLNRPARRAEPE